MSKPRELQEIELIEAIVKRYPGLAPQLLSVDSSLLKHMNTYDAAHPAEGDVL